jgi:Protein of unknown function (DUF3703)
MTRFAPSTHVSVQLELDAASRFDAHGDAELAFRHLERAHVLGQVSTAVHVRVHWRMLLWAIRNRQPGEAAGQVWRLLAAALFTGIGWVPAGNTGGAKVSGFRPMSIPPDLKHLMDDTRS